MELYYSQLLRNIVIWLCVLFNMNALGSTIMCIATSGRPKSQPITFNKCMEIQHRILTMGIYPQDLWHVLIEAANYFLVELDARDRIWRMTIYSLDLWLALIKAQNGKIVYCNSARLLHSKFDS